jgi:hypothetical protein
METSVSVLVDAKREYTKQLIQVIRPYLLTGVLSIYDEAFNVCQENKESDLTMLTFQELLGEVPKWNNVMIVDETERIVTDSKCDYLEDLLTAVFVCHTKILTTVRVTNKDRKINLKIPCVENFVHQVYIEMAREFWKHPYLLNPLDVSKLEYQQNLKKAETLIHECLESTIRKLLPVKDILKEYLVEDNVSDDEIDDLDISKEQSHEDLVGGGSDRTAETDLSPGKNVLVDSMSSASNQSDDSSDTKKTIQKQLTNMTKDAELTVEKDNAAAKVGESTNHNQNSAAVPQKSVFNAMLDAIEGNPKSAPNTDQIKTVSTSAAKGSTPFVGGGGSSSPSTTDCTKKINITTPMLSSLNTTPSPSSPLATSCMPSSPSSPVTQLSMSSLTGGSGSPSTGTSSSSEISLDNLGAIEEVNVNFGRPSSPTPSITSDVLSEFDKMAAMRPSPSASPPSSPVPSLSVSASNPFTFF